MNEIVLCFSNFCLFLLTLAGPTTLFSSLGAADFIYTKKRTSRLEKLLCFNVLNRPQMLIVELGLAYTVSKAEGVPNYWGELVRAQKFRMGVERLWVGAKEVHIKGGLRVLEV